MKTNSGRVAGIVVVVDDCERRRTIRVRVLCLGMAEIVWIIDFAIKIECRIQSLSQGLLVPYNVSTYPYL